jgi:hypothetical protein
MYSIFINIAHDILAQKLSEQKISMNTCAIKRHSKLHYP